MPETQNQPSQQELFSYLSKELGVTALLSNMEDIERIVLESENIELKKLLAIQDYLQEHGSNDEKINKKIRELQGFKTH